MKELVYIPGPFFTKKDILTTGIISVAYLLLSYTLIGYKPEQLVLTAIFNTLYYLSPATRKFIMGFSVFIVYWIIYDYMKAFPNYMFNTVQIESLYRAEKNLFGVYAGGVLITPNEYWLQHANTFLDVLTGFFYLCWVPVPLLFAGYLFFRNREQFFYFSLTFLLINIIGFVVYYIYPAAPPWYVQEYGFSFHSLTAGNVAGLKRFDDYFGITVFKSLYEKGSNVFAAMPSLHSSYPLLVLYYGVKNKLGWINMVFAFVTAGIWFAAVYTSHHYILDVIAGIVCAFLGIVVFALLARRYEQYVRNKRRKWISLK
jgi:inositol phosphorylceramide synthase catalytic subunit